MYEKENELINALCGYKNSKTERIKELLADPLDFAYVLGKLIYSGTAELAWYTICAHGLQGSLNREVRNTLMLLSE